MGNNFKCDKRIINMNAYIEQLKMAAWSSIRIIENRKNDIERYEKEIPEESEIKEEDKDFFTKKKRRIAGMRSGLTRKIKQMKKIVYYYRFIKKNRKFIQNIWVTHETIDFIMTDVLNKKKFSRSFVSRFFIPEYIEPQEDMSIKNFLASVSYIKKNIDISPAHIEGIKKEKPIYKKRN